ncbi:hypothetical protein AcW1_002954 [Taiwanofungus camphoratus]|nr:hypothetical protein AcV5_001860 [Antrodia cinnamomea]KAI0925372.1 hypothetical protein AcV7_005635 [Antrodia cinnamomea]KAI0942285.1 hypothetical protein AcW1_002954 [Antrodia cinnamomea]
MGKLDDLLRPEAFVHISQFRGTKSAPFHPFRRIGQFVMRFTCPDDNAIQIEPAAQVIAKCFHPLMVAFLKFGAMKFNQITVTSDRSSLYVHLCSSDSAMSVISPQQGWNSCAIHY